MHRKVNYKKWNKIFNSGLALIGLSGTGAWIPKPRIPD